MTDIDFDARLDGAHIRAAAVWVADQLAATGVARVRITPGDMTAYEVIVVGREVPEWEADRSTTLRLYRVVLANSFGAAYPWGGDPVDPSYAGQKWTNPTCGEGPRLWTGEVVARFLNALAVAMGEGK